MTDDPAGAPWQAGVGRGLRVSVYSLIWTIAAGSAAVVVGVIGNTLSLIVFGAIGLLDAVGSATLVIQFRHSLRHEGISHRHDRMTLLVVSAGMAGVGLATMADSAYRLVSHGQASPPWIGVGIAASSVIALTVLARYKRAIAAEIHSRALRADGRLSAVGAVLAATALLGVALDRAFDWWWIDPVAAIAVALAAISMGAGAIVETVRR